MGKSSFVHRILENIGWPTLLIVSLLCIMVINTNVSCSNKDEKYKAQTNPSLILSGTLLALCLAVIVWYIADMGIEHKNSMGVALNNFGKMFH